MVETIKELKKICSSKGNEEWIFKRSDDFAGTLFECYYYDESLQPGSICPVCADGFIEWDKEKQVIRCSECDMESHKVYMGLKRFERKLVKMWLSAFLIGLVGLTILGVVSLIATFIIFMVSMGLGMWKARNLLIAITIGIGFSLVYIYSVTGFQR